MLAAASDPRNRPIIEQSLGAPPCLRDLATDRCSGLHLLGHVYWTTTGITVTLVLVTTSLAGMGLWPQLINGTRGSTRVEAWRLGATAGTLVAWAMVSTTLSTTFDARPLWFTSAIVAHAVISGIALLWLSAKED